MRVVLSGDVRVVTHRRGVCGMRGGVWCVRWLSCTVTLRVFDVLRLVCGPLVSGKDAGLCVGLDKQRRKLRRRRRSGCGVCLCVSVREIERVMGGKGSC